jgi:hypothetical protein
VSTHGFQLTGRKESIVGPTLDNALELLPLEKFIAEWTSGEHSPNFDGMLTWILARVTRYVRFLVGSHDLGESATMEALGNFCRIVQRGYQNGSRATFKSYEGVVRYLCVVAVREARRKSAKARRTARLPEGFDVPDSAPAPSDCAGEAEFQDRLVDRALRIIEEIKDEARDEHERRIIELLIEKEVFGRSLSYGAIGARCGGRSASTVTRIRDNLRLSLEKGRRAIRHLDVPGD